MVNANKSKQVSEQQQQAQSTANSEGFNLGMQNAFNQGQSTQGGSSFGQSSQDVWGGNTGALGDLFGAAQGLIGASGGAGAGAQGVANDARNAWMQQLTPGGNPYFSQSMQGAIDAASRGFTQNVLPEMDARGVAAGQYGGARDQLARGQAAGQFGTELQNMAAQMGVQQYTADQNRALGALGMGGQVQGMQLSPLQLAGSLIGGPTVLGQSSQGASNFGQSSTAGGSSGINYGQNQSAAQSSSSGYGGSTGRSGGFGILSK